jgi:hypothetical protein
VVGGTAGLREIPGRKSVTGDNDYDNIIIIFINCNWVVTRWQWLFNTYTKHEMGFLLNLRPEGYMRSM